MPQPSTQASPIAAWQFQTEHGRRRHWLFLAYSPVMLVWLWAAGELAGDPGDPGSFLAVISGAGLLFWLIWAARLGRLGLFIAAGSVHVETLIPGTMDVPVDRRANPTFDISNDRKVPALRLHDGYSTRHTIHTIVRVQGHRYPGHRWMGPNHVLVRELGANGRPLGPWRPTGLIWEEEGAAAVLGYFADLASWAVGEGSDSDAPTALRSTS